MGPSEAMQGKEYFTRRMAAIRTPCPDLPPEWSFAEGHCATSPERAWIQHLVRNLANSAQIKLELT